MSKQIFLIMTIVLYSVSVYSGTVKRIEAEACNAYSSGVKIESNSNLSGTGNVGYITNGSWIKFAGHVFSEYDYQFSFAASSQTAGGNIELRLDATNGTLIGTATVTSTSSWSNYQVVAAAITQTSGTHDLYLVFTGGSGYLFNLDYFDVHTTDPGVNSYSFSTNVTPASTGTVVSDIVGSSIGEGTEITITAKPTYGFDFVKWTDNDGNFVSSANPFVFKIKSNTSLLAHFKDGTILTLTPPNTGGFANVAGTGIQTVTGGNGSYVVVVKTLSELISYATSANPYTIIVNGHITADPWVSINVTSNKTIVGYGNDATLNNMELHLIEKKNIIIRNLIIKDSKVPTDLIKEFDYDAIQSDSCHHLWIDHCYLSNCNDGLIDLRYSSDYVTVSWSHLSNHNKALGIGWTSATDYRITIHHNWIDNTVQRNPSFDNGTGHLYNNYLSNISSYGNYARGSAINVIQNSKFYNVKDPLGYDVDAVLYSSGNQFENCSGSNTGNVSVMPFNPADFYTYTLDPTSEVPSMAMAGSGPQWAVGNEYVGLLPKATLATSVIGNGKLTPENGEYLASGLIHIKALPNAGWKFDHWSGDITGANPDTTITLDANMAITAHFVDKNTTGIEKLNDDSLISCFYNPSAKSVQILSTDSDSIDFELFSIDGRKVLAGTVYSSQQSISVRNLKNGVYIIKMVMNNQYVTQRIMIN